MFKSLLVHIFVVFYASGIVNSMEEFSFQNQSEWPKDFPDCGKKNQSPVNIDTSQLQKSTGNSQVNFEGYSNKPANLVLANQGQTVMLTGRWDSDDLIPRISGGPLTGVYIFDNIHFIWSDQDQAGSDHAIDGQRFSVEMHVTHRKDSYDNLMEALKYPDGLAVVAVIFEKVEQAGKTSLSSLEKFLPKVVEKGDNVDLPLMALEKLGTRLGSGYYSYHGSYVIPPCSVSVTYLIDEEIKPISDLQMKLFRNVTMEFGDVSNVRNLQSLDGRTVNLMTNE